MPVAANADAYTVGRLNMFFPAHNQTPADGNLTGQCVTLIKWFMAEMASVPSPFAARGDARYVGKNLVAQGHAVEVPYAQRKRGDIICYEYGTYGHIAVQLSGGRVFEENVNMGGVASKIVDGARVYASRIGSEAESWRHDQHVYRLKSYNEAGDEKMIIPDQDNWYGRFRRLHQQLLAQDLDRETFRKYIVGQDAWYMIEYMSDDARASKALDYQRWGKAADDGGWWQKMIDQDKAIADYKAGGVIPQSKLDGLAKQADDLEQSIKNAKG